MREGPTQQQVSPTISDQATDERHLIVLKKCCYRRASELFKSEPWIIDLSKVIISFIALIPLTIGALVAWNGKSEEVEKQKQSENNEEVEKKSVSQKTEHPLPSSCKN